jgi:hypothetical protein
MSSYFTLTLDTTNPIIQIYAPSYTSRESNNIITIVGNETLSSFQNIYIVDSKGDRHDVTFSFNGTNTFTGNIVLSGFPVGVSTIFAQLQDEVGNFSNIATAHISVITSTYHSLFKLKMSEESRNEKTDISTRNIAISSTESVKTISEKNRQVTLDNKTRLTIVSDTK